MELSIMHPNNFKSVVTLNHHSYAMVQSVYFLIYRYLNAHYETFLWNLGTDLSLFERSLRNFLMEFR